MTRAAFDPSRIRGPEAGPLFQPESRVVTVSQLTRMIRAAVVDSLPAALQVVGQISNFKRHSGSGHCYFTLKDADAQIACVMWRTQAARLKFKVQDGMEVVAGGHVDVYEVRGQVQLYCDRLEPRGVGALELAFRQLHEKLSKQGLFDPRHKRPIPRYPRRIAVVTSPTGAAVRDFVQTVRRRYPPVRLVLCPVRVQGDGAAEEIAQAIELLNEQESKLDIDVLVLARGGGSIEDLWAFNEEAVARAIFASRIPIISGVGHETDVTIADLVADLRAPTPTAAAELAVPRLDEILDDLEQKSGRLRRGLRGRLDLARAHFQRVQSCPLFSRPLDVVSRHGQRLDEVCSRLDLAVRRTIQTMQRRWHRCQVVLLSVGPQQILARQHHRFDGLAHRLSWAQGRRNRTAERMLERVTVRLGRVSPEHQLPRYAERLAVIERQSASRMRGLIEVRLQRLKDLEARLSGCGPESVLRRGYTLTRDGRTGKLIRSAAALRPGQRIRTEFQDGRRESRVIDEAQLDPFPPDAPSRE